MLKKLGTHYEKNFLTYEWTLPAVVVLAVPLIPWLGSVNDFLLTLLEGSRGQLYGAMASLYGSLLGFGIAALAIVLTTIDSPRLETIRKSKHYETFWKVFTSGVRWLGVACVFSLVAMVIDKDSAHQDWVFYLMAYCSIVSFCRVGRMIWVMEALIAITANLKKP